MRAAEVAKIVAHSWKVLPDQERSKWQEMARLDRARYEREKAAYKGPWKVPDIKDPNKPKKPVSAFLAFANKRRKAIADANPSLTGTQISSLLSQLWKACPPAIQQSYRDEEAHKREIYKRKRYEWEQRSILTPIISDAFPEDSCSDSVCSQETHSITIDSSGSYKKSTPNAQHQYKEKGTSNPSEDRYSSQESVEVVQHHLLTPDTSSSSKATFDLTKKADLAFSSSSFLEPLSTTNSDVNVSPSSLLEPILQSVGDILEPSHFNGLPTRRDSLCEPRKLPPNVTRQYEGIESYSLREVLESDELFEDFAPVEALKWFK